MNKMMKLYWKVFAEPFIRRPFIKRIRERYNSDNMPSIICSNCIGGEIYHDLGMKFYSPTINLWMSESDFLKSAPKRKLLGFANNGPKSVMAPTPIKIIHVEVSFTDAD